MTAWVRHRWVLDEACCEGVGEAYVERGSASDDQLQRCFQLDTGESWTRRLGRSPRTGS